MATIMELINSFDNNSKEYDEFLRDLVTFNSDIPFNTDEVERAQSAIISTINGRLNQSHTRYSGLLLLDKILQQCSKDILSKYCMLWISKATQVLESVHSSPQELSLSCKIIGRLITQTKEISEIHKQISLQNVKQLIAIFGNIESSRRCGALYYLIAVLLYQYPEVCERFQVHLRKIILLQLDSTEKNVVNAGAKCYTLLAKATERSFKAPPAKPTYNCWVYNQTLICNSLHDIMDALFSGLIELESVDVWDKLELPLITEENVIEYYSKQKQRFLNLCSYLSVMLCGYNKKNSVSPHDILKLLCRGLAIQPTNLKNQNSFKEQMLYLIMPQLHTALFTVLYALITGFKEQLIPFGSTILQLFRRTLQWTETVLENQTTINGNKPFMTVRISLYKCISCWLMNTSSLSGIETVADEYLPSILKDIVPERDRVLLTIQKTQNLSKRALKRFRDSQYEKSVYLNNGATSKKLYSLDIDICKEALITLQNIFANGGCWLKQGFYKIVQNATIPILYDCYLNSSGGKFYKESITCRLQLLKVLRVLQINSHSLTPPPTQYSLEIFEMALHDADFHIIQESKKALAEIEKIIHPDAPTLQLTQIEEMQKEFIDSNEDQDRIAVLESAGTVSDGNTVDIDVEPTSNKRIRINSAEENDNSMINAHENQTVNNVEKPDLIENNAVSEDMDDQVSAPLVKETIETSENEMQPEVTTIHHDETNERKSIQDKEAKTLKQINRNPELVCKVSEENIKMPSMEDSGEETEILQLFHDETKNDN